MFISRLASLRLTRTTLRQRDKRQYLPSPRLYPFMTTLYRSTPPPPRAEGWRQRKWQISTIVTFMRSLAPDVDRSSSRTSTRYGMANCATHAQSTPRLMPSCSWHTCALCALVFTKSMRSRFYHWWCRCTKVWTASPITSMCSTTQESAWRAPPWPPLMSKLRLFPVAPSSPTAISIPSANSKQASSGPAQVVCVKDDLMQHQRGAHPSGRHPRRIRSALWRIRQSGGAATSPLGWFRHNPAA